MYLLGQERAWHGPPGESPRASRGLDLWRNRNSVALSSKERLLAGPASVRGPVGVVLWAWRAGCWHSMLHCGRCPAKLRFPGSSSGTRRGGAAARASVAVTCGDKVARKPEKAKKAKKDVPTPPAQVVTPGC